MKNPYLIKKYSKHFLEKEYKKCLSTTELYRKLKIHYRTLLGLFKYYDIKQIKKILSPSHKKLIKKALIGRPSPMRDKKQTKKAKKIISLKMSGKNNPFYGRKHSVKTRKKMSKNHADFTGDKNPLARALKRSPKKRARYGLMIKRKWAKMRECSPEKYKSFREKLSNSMVKAHINHKLESYGRGHKHGKFHSIKQQAYIYYRSSYEYLFLSWCEKEPKIKTFRTCNFSIKYFKNGSMHNYIPDFIINNDFIIEIKPIKLVASNKEKMRAAKKIYHKKFIVLTESDIKNNFKKLLRSI